MAVDVGTTTLTGLQLQACEASSPLDEVSLSHPVLATLPLGAAQLRSVGSDFVRAGLVFSPPRMVGDEFTDAYGVRWLWGEGQPAPLHHPLEDAEFARVAAYPRPQWPSLVQAGAPAAGQLLILDAPCAGLLETCFSLRNGWQFMSDLTDHWRVANALLDWSLDTVMSAYEQALAGLPRAPDLLLYGDDYGFSSGMFLSVIDFRNFVRPRLQTLLARLRRLCPAPMLFHSCGAVRPIVGDLAGLGIEALNLDPVAREMILPEVRRELPADVVLHGPIDFVALGQALARRDMKSIAILSTELAACAPAIAAPIDNLASHDELLACQRAAAFVHALDADDWAKLRRFGAVSSVLEHGIAAARDLPPLAPIIARPYEATTQQERFPAHASLS
jgi:hypothetical protein